LVKLGFDEEVIFATERQGLLDMLAEPMVNPPPEVTAQVITVGELQLREITLKEQELKLRDAVLQQQIAFRDAELIQNAQDREAERQQQAKDREADRELERFQLQQLTAERQAELELRKAEVHLQEQQANEDLVLRRAEAARLRERDNQLAEREQSLVAQSVLVML